MSFCYFALFLVVVNDIRSRREIENLIFKITLAGFLVSVFAIVQFFSGAKKIYWVKEVTHSGIIFGPFINENHFAAYISMIALVTLGSIFASIYTKESRHGYYYSFKRRLLSILEGSLNNRAFFIIFAFAIMVTALFLSKSRGGISFFIAGVGFFILSLFFKKGIKKVFWVSLFAFFIILFLLSWVGMERTLKEMSTIFTSMQLADRVRVWEEARGLLRDYPIFGIGIGAFSDIFPMYRAGFDVTFYPHLHNEILELFVEAGVFGLIVITIPFVIFLLRFFTACGKMESSYRYYASMGILASFLYVGLDALINFSMRLNAISALFVILLALALLLMHLTPLADKGTEIAMRVKKLFMIKNTKSRTILYVLSSFIFVYLCFIVSKPLIAYTLAENAASLSAFEKAIGLDPKNDALYYDYHNFILIQGDLGLINEGSAHSKAKGALDKAIALNPHKSAYLVAKGFVELGGENYKEASSALREATLMEPSNHRVLLTYAYMLFQEGLNEKDEKQKNALLKKGLIHYKTARFLCSYVNFYSAIDDKKSYRELAGALKKEGIEIQ